jgi:hypothetical protein
MNPSKERRMNRVMRIAGAALALTLFTTGAARAGISDAGTTAANFLALGSGARTLSMGGATLGFGNDVGASSWNAAALGWVTAPELVLSHAGLQNNSLQEWAAYGGRVGQSQTRWAVTGLYQGDGSFEGRDATGASTGTFSLSSMAFGATVAQQFGENLTVGLGSKFVNENLGTTNGWGVTFDGGVMLRSGPFGFGAAAQNLGGQMHYGSQVFRFPGNVGAGISYQHPSTGLRLAIDANFPIAYYGDVRAGVEWMWHDMLALRAGYRQELGSANDALTGPSFGLGGGHNGMWVDYGYLISSAGDSQHRIGLRLDLARLGIGGPSMGQSDTPHDFESPKPAKADPSMIGPPIPKKKG